MKKIDYEWLKRILDSHDKLERGVPFDSKTSRCTKEVLLDRYFKFLDNRVFKLRLPIGDGKYMTEDEVKYEVFYAWFNKSKHTIHAVGERDGEVYYSYGIRKLLSWNDHEFTISFRDEKLNPRNFTYHWNGILRIMYEEISLEEYWEIVSLFMTPDVEIELSPDYNHCGHFDLAQGKYHCVSKDIKGSKCVGVECGFYSETR